MASQYTHSDHQQFLADMEAAGLQAEHCRGAPRLGGSGGPAVLFYLRQDALGANKGEGQLDIIGKGYVVHRGGYARHQL